MQNQSVSPDSGDFAEEPSAEEMRLSKSDKFLIAFGIIVLIGIEIWFSVLATVWALDGLLDLALLGDVVFGAVLTAPALWASYHLVRLTRSTT